MAPEKKKAQPTQAVSVSRECDCALIEMCQRNGGRCALKQGERSLPLNPTMTIVQPKSR